MAKNKRNILSRPLNLIFENTNAAIAADITVTKVIDIDKKKLLKVAVAKEKFLFLNMVTYASHEGSRGIHLMGIVLKASLVLNDELIIHKNGTTISKPMNEITI